MSDLSTTALWFKRAVPHPTEKSANVQIGCHFEEVVEMLSELKGTNADSEDAVQSAMTAVKTLADGLKAGVYSVNVIDRVKLLDALVDQIVTSTGVGHMLHMKVCEGLTEVNGSNFSKFNDDGQPIFLPNGKIAKGPNYRPADLTRLA